MKMNLGISNGKMWSIVLLLAVIFISLILSHMPFLVNNHYAYEGMTDVSGGKPETGVVAASTDAGAAPAPSANAGPSAEEPSIMDKLKYWFGLGASGSATGTAGAGASVGTGGVDASANVGGNTKGSANIGHLKGTVGASGSLMAGVAVDGSGNKIGSGPASTSTDSVMPATPALLKGKQENFEALKEGAHKKV